MCVLWRAYKLISLYNHVLYNDNKNFVALYFLLIKWFHPTASWFLVVVSLFQVAIADHDGILTCFGMKKGEAVVCVLVKIFLSLSYIQLDLNVLNTTF